MNSKALSAIIATSAAVGSTASIARSETYSDIIQDAGNTLATATEMPWLTANTNSMLFLKPANLGDIDWVKFNVPDTSKFKLTVSFSLFTINVGMFKLDGTGIKNSQAAGSLTWVDLQPIQSLPAGDYALYVSSRYNQPQTQSGQNIFPDGFETLPQTNQPVDHFSQNGSWDTLSSVIISMEGIQSVPSAATLQLASIAAMAGARRRSRS